MFGSKNRQKLKEEMTKLKEEILLREKKEMSLRNIYILTL